MAAYGGEHAGIAWDQFRVGLLDVLRWADLFAASNIRHQAISQKTMLPHGEHSSFGQIERANPWYARHAGESQEEIERRAEETTAREIAFLSTKPAIEFVAKTPAWRLDRIQRDAAGLVSLASEQIELAEPEIDSAFTHAIYYSRDDLRVRPTHRAMHGFAAYRGWKHWPTIVPPAAWNCRCFVRFIARHEAIDKGWLSKSGRILMDVRWPNTLAERNFQTGAFPEWKIERPWSFPSKRLKKAA